MYNYVKNDSRQQIEIMRRCTATALHDVFDFTEDLDDTFKILFFHATGISTIALFFGCTEIEVMRKIQTWGLYDWYNSPQFQLQLREHNAPFDNTTDHDVKFQRVGAMRSATAAFDCNRYVWTEEKRQFLFWMFCMGEDISEIAVCLECTEPMVMQKILDEDFYRSMNFPLFSYCNQEIRDRYLENYCANTK